MQGWRPSAKSMPSFNAHLTYPQFLAVRHWHDFPQAWQASKSQQHVASNDMTNADSPIRTLDCVRSVWGINC